MVYAPDKEYVAVIAVTVAVSGYYRHDRVVGRCSIAALCQWTLLLLC